MLGRHIRGLRLAVGASGGEFARRCGISRSMLSRVERGLASPSIATLFKMAAALKLPAFALLDPDTAFWRLVLIEALLERARSA